MGLSWKWRSLLEQHTIFCLFNQSRKNFCFTHSSPIGTAPNEQWHFCSSTTLLTLISQSCCNLLDLILYYCSLFCHAWCLFQSILLSVLLNIVGFGTFFLISWAQNTNLFWPSKVLLLIFAFSVCVCSFLNTIYTGYQIDNGNITLGKMSTDLQVLLLSIKTFVTILFPI